MRVIAGSAKGCRLAAPPGLTTRPTADRVKEALFSILMSRRRLLGAQVLDLCAGTGGLGIEALSRGAESCCFIDHDLPVCAVLKKNLAASGFVTKSECITLDILKGLLQLSQQKKSFDVVFFDPPYSSELYSEVLKALCAFSLLLPDAVVVAECSSRMPLAECFGGLVKFDRRVYGDTALEFFTGEPL